MNKKIHLTDLGPEEKKKLIQEIKDGKLFIYPTDTIYGIGCNALNAASVKKIRQLKKRDGKKSLSVIAPSKKWIREHFRIAPLHYLKKIPGPYTLLLPKKKKGFLKNASSNDLVGIRIPKHAFTKLVQEAGIPFVTTSVNVSGQPHAKKITDVPSSILRNVNRIVDVGPLTGKPSTLIDLSNKKPVLIRR